MFSMGGSGGPKNRKKLLTPDTPKETLVVKLEFWLDFPIEEGETKEDLDELVKDEFKPILKAVKDRFGKDVAVDYNIEGPMDQAEYKAYVDALSLGLTLIEDEEGDEDA